MDEVLPNALMMGVDYELFWELNPKSLSPFIKAFNLKQIHNDTLAWQFGSYVKLAIGSSLCKEVKYPSKPLMSKSKTKTMSPHEIRARVMDRVADINSRFGKE